MTCEYFKWGFIALGIWLHVYIADVAVRELGAKWSKVMLVTVAIFALIGLGIGLICLIAPDALKPNKQQCKMPDWMFDLPRRDHENHLFSGTGSGDWRSSRRLCNGNYFCCNAKLKLALSSVKFN